MQQRKVLDLELVPLLIESFTIVCMGMARYSPPGFKTTRASVPSRRCSCASTEEWSSSLLKSSISSFRRVIPKHDLFDPGKGDLFCSGESFLVPALAGMVFQPLKTSISSFELVRLTHVPALVGMVWLTLACGSLWAVL